MAIEPQQRLRQHYIAPKWQDCFRTEDLEHFDTWWHMPLDPVDQANYSSHGRSQVFYFEANGWHFYVKRQHNYLSYRLDFPIRVPTFKAEFDNISRYKSLAIPSLEPVYFAWKKYGTEQRAILITEALSEYKSLDDWLDAKTPIKIRRKIFRCLGKAVSQLHAAKIEHRHLYPKHIFIRMQHGEFDCRFIDLESSRSNFGFKHNKLRDLATLSRRTPQASRGDRLHFFAAYLEHPDIDIKLQQVQQKIKAGSRRPPLSTSLTVLLKTKWQTFKTEAAMMIYFVRIT